MKRCLESGVRHLPSPRLLLVNRVHSASESMHCPICSADNREAAKFCDSCGSALLNIAATLETSTGPASTTGERRHLTVLFCDLVNSTGIAAELDPEEWSD